MHQSQVIQDYIALGGKEWGDLSGEQQVNAKAAEQLALKRRLEGELSSAQAARHKELQDGSGFGQRPRLSNKDFLKRLDGMLMAGCGFGLANYIPKRQALPLKKNEVRYFVKREDPSTGEEENRSCLRLESGDTVFEVPRVVQEGQLVAPILHVSADQGSVGWPALVYLLYGRKCRMTLEGDIFHRCHNDVLEAVTTSGLMVIRLEYLQICRLRRGPWSGQANTSIMRSAALEMRRLHDHTSPLFVILYESIVRESPYLQSIPDIGSDEHMAKSFDWMMKETLGLQYFRPWGKGRGASRIMPERARPSQGPLCLIAEATCADVGA